MAQDARQGPGHFLALPMLALLGAASVKGNGGGAQSRRGGAADPAGRGVGNAGRDGRRPADPAKASASFRGRDASTPVEIPAPGWRDIMARTWREIAEDDVTSVARSIAFSGMLALFPALAAFVSIYGLFADVGQAREHLSALSGLVPAQAMNFIGEHMLRLASAGETGLSLTFVLGLLVSLWSANNGMKALFKGLNIAYEEDERRSFVRLNLTTLGFTLGGILFAALAIGATIAAPVLMAALRLDGAVASLAFLRWPLLLVLSGLGLSALYRFGPSRQTARWRWVTPGGAAASVTWVLGSAGFSAYLSGFADYDATYGSLGAVFGFMVWLWLSSLVVLIGAELNAEIEHQTCRDSTTGPEEPIGQRGAVMADTVGAPAPVLPEPLHKLLQRLHPKPH